MQNVSSAGTADTGPADIDAAERLTVRTWTADDAQPVEERLPPAEAERRFAEMRDEPERWPSTFAAELSGPDGDVMDRW